MGAHAFPRAPGAVRGWVARAHLSVLAVAALLAVAGCGQSAPHPVPSGPMAGSELGDALREGGYVLFLRHTTSDTAVDQGGPPQVTDCGRQRNLSRVGREEAERLGEDVRAVGVPVGRVLASPFCRTMETAELAFGGADEEPRLLQADSEQAAADLTELLANPPSRGNTWLVGHVGNIGATTGIHINEGEAAVFAPGGDGEFTLVGTIPVDGWSDLDRSDGGALSRTSLTSLDGH